MKSAVRETEQSRAKTKRCEHALVSDDAQCEDRAELGQSGESNYIDSPIFLSG